MATRADIRRKQRLQDLDKMLGEHLALLRKQSGIPQEDVAKELGFQRPLVSKIENGHRSLAACEIPDYARAIGSSTEDIIAFIKDIAAGS